MTWQLIALLLAFMCFAFAALKVEPQRVALVPLGLALWVLTLVVR